jgi:type I restriction enzyme M protein
MNTQSSTIVRRLWNYCNVLRDDDMSYGDYVEQLTYLLFLKMDHENSKMLHKPSAIPAEFNWAGLLRLDGEELERHYRDILAVETVEELQAALEQFPGVEDEPGNN